MFKTPAFAGVTPAETTPVIPAQAGIFLGSTKRQANINNVLKQKKTTHQWSIRFSATVIKISHA